MAGNLKKIIIALLLFLIPNFARSENLPLSTLVTSQNIQFEQCTKTFAINSERLFYLTIASINANRFRIDEIQSKMGYVMFNAVGKEFLASVVKIDNTKSLLKITPTNNVYYFQPGIVLNLFKYIELNKTLIPTTVLIN